MAIGSPSPLPPPRSKARGEKGAGLVTADAPSSGVSGSSDSTVTAVTGDVKLAEGLLGTVVLLAAEWVEVGSGLAEVSMRADTWGDRLLDILLHQVCFDTAYRIEEESKRISCRLGPIGVFWVYGRRKPIYFSL